MPSHCVYINGAAALSHLGLTTELNQDDFCEQDALRLAQPNMLYRPMADVERQNKFDVLLGQLSQVIDALICKHSLSAEQLSNTVVFIGSSSLDIGTTRLTENPNDCFTPIDTIATALIDKYQFTPLEFTFSTACTASANALIYAGKLIERQQIERAIVIGCEFFNQLTVQGFESLGLVSDTSQRSMARDRDGLILGEGVGGLLLSNTKCELTQLQLLGGYSSCDTYSLTTTQEDGQHIQTVINQSLVSAGCQAVDIDLVKVHATASQANDMAEAAALRHVFSDNIPPVFALKPYIGHTLGACGALEIALLHQLCHADFLPVPDYAQTNNAQTNKTDCLLPFVHSNQSLRGVDKMLINHFGFGGNNATLVVGRVHAALKKASANENVCNGTVFKKTMPNKTMLNETMLNCIAQASVSFERHLTNKEVRKLVKGETGLDVRRMDNFSLVAINAAYRLLSQQTYDGKIGLYSAAKSFSNDLLHRLLVGIESNDEMRPVDFISTVGNTANYYVAKLFDVTGPNLFIGTSKQAISKLDMLAACDLEQQIVDYALTLEWIDDQNCYKCEAKLLKLT